MRWVVGWLLVGAAVLKAAQLVIEPAVAFVGPLGSWFLIGPIGVELGLGLTALSGSNWRHVRWIAVLLFAGFAAYSLYLAVAGAASCGCFGSLHIHPWWTFALDTTIVGGLLFSISHWESAGKLTDYTCQRSFVPRGAFLAAVFGVVGLCVALLVRHADMRTASADDLLSAEGGRLVVLVPDRWIGKPLPIADWIDLDVSKGDWTVLLYRHDCPACQELVSHYEESARHSATEQIAIIEVPPYGKTNPRNDGLHARLGEDRDWFVQTPVEIRMSNGMVKSTSTELPTMSASRAD